MVECPECGKLLVKRTKKGKFQCENKSCPVIYVRYPKRPMLRSVIYDSSKRRK